MDGSQLIGRRNSNPLLDTRLYSVKFHDEGVLKYSANLRAETLYSSTDEHGRTYNIITRIIDHRSNDNAIKKSEGWIELNDRKTKKVTTQDGNYLYSGRMEATVIFLLKTSKNQILWMWLSMQSQTIFIMNLPLYGGSLMF